MTKIQLRHDTAANWASTNPILAEGEAGFETDTNKIKLGDGTKNYNDLEYLTSNSSNALLNDGSNATEGFKVNGITLSNNIISTNTTNNSYIKLERTGGTDYAQLGTNTGYGYLELPSCTLKGTNNNPASLSAQHGLHISGTIYNNGTETENIVTTRNDLYALEDFILITQKPEITSWGFPSSQYTNLTLGASGTNYTAPEDGWFYITAQQSSGGGYVWLRDVDNRMETKDQTAYTDSMIMAYLPVSKGKKCLVYYINIKNISFRFVYANGTQPTT